MQEDYRQVIRALRLHSTNVKQANAVLDKILVSSPATLELLFRIIQDESLESNLRQLASFFLNTNLKEMQIDIQPRAILEFFDKYFKSTLTYATKVNLQSSVVELMQSTMETMCDDWIRFATSLLQEPNSRQVSYFLMYCAAQASDQIRPTDFAKLFSAIFFPSLESIITNKPNCKEMIEWARHSNVMLTTLQKIVKQTSDKECISELDKAVYDKRLVALILSVYNQDCSEERGLISKHTHINQLKFDIAEMHNFVIERIFAAHKKKPMPDAHIELLRCIMPTLISTLLYVARNHDPLQVFPGMEFTVELLHILKISIKMVVFRDDFALVSMSLLNQIIFPLLKAGPTERKKFVQSPEQFIGLAEDLCHKQQFQEVKSQVAAVLEALMDNIQGVSKSVFTWCLATVQAKLTGQPFINPQLTVESSLLILTGLSYLYQKSQSMQDELRKVFNNDKILAELDEIEICRLFQFLSYNFQDVIADQVKIKALAQTVLAFKPESRTVQVVILDLVNNIVEQVVSMEMFHIMSDRLLVCSELLLFEIILTIITKHHSLIPESSMLYMLDRLFTLIATQFRPQETLIQRRDHQNLVKCLDVLIGVAMNHFYLQDKPLVQDRIFGATAMLRYHRKLDFDQWLLRILNQHLICQTNLQQRELELLPILHQIQQQSYAGMLLHLYPVLNQYILKMPKVYPLSEHHLLVLSCLSQTTKSQHASCSEVDIVEGLLLLQLFVDKFWESFDAVHVDSILKILGAAKVARFTAKIKLTNAYLLLYPAMAKYGMLQKEFVVKRLHQCCKKYKYTYDINSLVVAVSRLLFVEEDITTISDCLSCLTLPLEVLHNIQQTAKQKTNLKQKSSKQSKHPSFQKSLENINSQWVGLDAFAHLRIHLQTLRNMYPERYRQILAVLPADVLEKLKMAVQTNTQASGEHRRIVKVAGIQKHVEIGNDHKQSENKNNTMVEEKQVSKKAVFLARRKVSESEDEKPVQDEDEPIFIPTKKVPRPF